jgi:hypothetical protein
MNDYVYSSMKQLMKEKTIFFCREEKNLKSLLFILDDMSYTISQYGVLISFYDKLKTLIPDYFILSSFDNKRITIHNNKHLSFYKNLRIESNKKLSVIDYDDLRFKRKKCLAKDMLNEKLYRELLNR